MCDYFNPTKPSGFDREDSSSTFLKECNRMFYIYNLRLTFSLTYKFFIDALWT